MNSPSPSKASVMCDSGARSPEAPTEPCEGMWGTRPALNTSNNFWITTGRTPECARPRLAALSARMSRTTGAAIGSPTPTLCERMRLRCRAARSSAPMRVRASLPKPVLTP